MGIDDDHLLRAGRLLTLEPKNNGNVAGQERRDRPRDRGAAVAAPHGLAERRLQRQRRLDDDLKGE